MVVLVAIGVVSASLFARSACEGLVPEPVTLPSASTDADEVLPTAFEQVGPVALEGFGEIVAALEAEFGALTGLAAVPGATRLAPVPDGAVTTGEAATRLGMDGDRVLAAVDPGEGTLVGDGHTLYSLAIGNPLTGQVDAFVPLDPGFDPGTCVDTAVVGAPFAFHLDAGDGQLLLLRTEEDASVTEVELREGGVGRRWEAGVPLETAPPGLLGERLTGRLTPGLAVVAARTEPGAEVPVVIALDRGTGRLRWTLSRDDLGGNVTDEVPQWVRVLAADDEQVVLELRPESDERPDDAGSPALVAVDAADGTVRWSDLSTPAGATADAVVTSGGRVLVAFQREGHVVVDAYGAEGRTTLAAVPGREAASLVALPDGGAILVTEELALPLDGAAVPGDRLVFGALRASDVVLADGTTRWLLTGPEGGAVVATFGT